MEAKSTKHPQTEETTTQSTSAESSLADQDATSTDVVVDNAKCSNKIGIIVGVVLGLVMVALVAFALIWSCIYRNPTKVAADAMNKFFSAKNVALNGTITLKSTDKTSNLELLHVTFDAASTNLPNASNVNIRGYLKDSDTVISVDVGTVQMSDGVIYIQLEGLIDTLAELDVNEDDLGWIYEAIELIDNEWWRIDLTEISNALESDQDDAKRLQDTYACVTQELNNDIRGELGSLYRANDFINLGQADEARFNDGGTYNKSFEGTDYYEVSIDYRKMAGFINGLATNHTLTRIYSCINENYPGTNLSAEDFNEVTASELEEAFIKDTTTEVYLEIGRWGHELKHLISQSADDDMTTTFDLFFTYNDGAQITAPDNYRPVTDLIEEATDMVTEFYQGLQTVNNGGVTLI